MVWIYVMFALLIGSFIAIMLLIFYDSMKSSGELMAPAEDDKKIAELALEVAKKTEKENQIIKEKLRTEIAASIKKEKEIKEKLINKKQQIDTATTEEIKAYLEKEGISVEIVKPE